MRAGRFLVRRNGAAQAKNCGDCGQRVNDLVPRQTIDPHGTACPVGNLTATPHWRT